MASEWNASLKEINGVNLANYFPHQRSINSVVFIHKKYLNDHQNPELKKEKAKSKKEKKYKQDKGQQFCSDKNTEISENNKTYKITNTSDPVLEQTIRFAKNLVPLVIPQSDEKIPVFYTVKSSKKHKRKEKKVQETSFDHHATRDEKGDGKKVFETYKKIRKENISVRESLSHGSSNTIDDLNNNQSISCTYSEVSEKKYHRKEKSHHKKQNDGSKFVVSESFDALTTEYPGDSQIKIHLMNEKDKQSLSESIKTPIMTALKECITEISNCNLMTDITSVQKILKCNTSKLDLILERISCIESKLDSHVLERKSETRSTQSKVVPKVLMPEVKPSVLEQLEEDVIEKDDFSSEEELHQELLYRRSKSSVVTELMTEDKSTKNPSSGAGEVTGGVKELSSAGVKADRPNRIPARFCWTDAARK